LKKNWVVLLFLFLFVVLVPSAFAQDTLSGEILTQAKAQADLFLELKNALGLDWLDKYNTYLRDPSANPEPSWTLSVQDLINNGYLSAGFPSDFSLSLSGAEVVISRQISTQSIRDAVTIYLPSATISGNTVSLLVQRPAQWIAWQDALNGKVSRDGSGDPDILPGADLDFGSGSKIEFVSSDGKILGVDSLTYKGEELEDRFVNVSGDNMTGPLYIEGNIVWHAGNDGSGSGLDADLLDGKDSSFFTNADNLISGVVPVDRLSGTYDIDISGNAATATKLATARTISLTGDASGSASFDGSSNISINTNVSYSSNSDKLDGYHASEFVKKSGDTMTGNLSFNSPSNVGIVGNPNTWTKIDPNGQRFIVTIPGSLTDGNPNFPVIDLERTDNWQHLWELKASGDMTVRGNPVWHAGNDGLGSGLDADYIDGKNAEWGLMKQKEVLTVILSPFEQKLDNGMCYDGQYLWCAGEGATAAVVSPNGALVRTVSSPGFIGSTGLAWDGQYVWSVCGNGDGKVYKINPANGNVLLSFNAPAYEMYGLTYDGTYLWGISAATNRVYCFSKNGSVIKSFPFPGLFCDGLAWDGTYLWGVIGDNNTERYSNIICKFTTNGEFLEFYSMPSSDYNSITFDGNFLWVFNCMTRTIEKLSLKTLPVVTYLQ